MKIFVSINRLLHFLMKAIPEKKQYLFALALLLCIQVYHGQAQVPQLFNYPKEQRVIRLYHLAVDRRRDSASFAVTLDSVGRLAQADRDKKLEAYARLLKAAHFPNEDKLPVAKSHLWQEKDYFEGSPFAEIRASYAFFSRQPLLPAR